MCAELTMASFSRSLLAQEWRESGERVKDWFMLERAGGGGQSLARP
jgi:hypothetical protein